MYKLQSSEISYLESRYKDIVPGKWNDFITSLQTRLDSCFWVQSEKISSTHLVELLSNYHGATIEPLSWHKDAYKVKNQTTKIGNSVEYHSGFFHLQEEVSMIPATLLTASPKDKVLDMCAAPGGKTMQILHQIKNQGTVVANDWNIDRLKILRSHAARMGFSNLITMVGDGSRINDTEHSYDRVLADVPCSCEGTARKNKSVFTHGMEDGELFQGGIQIGILKKAMELTKPGGEIVYSTCTFRPEENEYVVNQALKRSSEWDIIPLKLDGFIFSEGIKSWQGVTFCEDMKYAMRIWPHQNDTGGFFVCKLKRKI